jgi:hypothetical protein
MPRRSDRLRKRCRAPAPRFGRPGRLRRRLWTGESDDSDLELPHFGSDRSDDDPFVEDPISDSEDSVDYAELLASEAGSDDDDVARELASQLEDDSDDGDAGTSYDQVDTVCARGTMRLRVSDFARLVPGALQPVLPWLPADEEPVVRLEALSCADPADAATAVVTLCVTAAQLARLGWPLSPTEPVADGELLVCLDCHATVSCLRVRDTVAVELRRPRPAEPARGLRCWRALAVDAGSGRPASSRTQPLAEVAPPAEAPIGTQRLLRGALERYDLPEPGEDGYLLDGGDAPVIAMLRQHGAADCVRFGTGDSGRAVLRHSGASEGFAPRLERPRAVLRACEACHRPRPCRAYVSAGGRTLWLGRSCAAKVRAAAELEAALRWIAAHPHRAHTDAAADELCARLQLCRVALRY